MSAFCKHFAAAIKVNNKILRESKFHQTDAATVHLPFGSEYSLLLKNLSAQRAVVTVTIDGTDVLGGKSIIINPNTSFELERFVDNLATGNKFKFINKTEQISDHRGDKVDDGIVRIEYQFEKPYQPMVGILMNEPWPRTYYGSGFDGYQYLNNIQVGCSLNDTVFSSKSVDGVSAQSVKCASTMNVSATSASGSATGGGILRGASLSASNSAPAPSEDGITVKGSVSNQKFSKGSIGALEDEVHVITLQLRGKTETTVVEEAITVDLKSTCPTCGTKYRGFPKFCSNCGTAMSASL